MIKSNNIIMDTSYSKAIVLASLESNDASVADEDSTIEKAALWLGCSVAEADYRHEISPKELMSSILDKPSTGKKRFRRSALEMALFYDRMILFGVPNEVCLDKLEDEGVLRVMAHAGQNFENESFGAAHPVLLFFIKMMKNPSVVKDIMRDINSTLRLVKRPPVSYKIASYAYDTILKVAFAGINLYVLQEYLTKGLLNKRLLITEECPAKDIILEAVFTVYQKTSVYPEISIIYFMAALRCIIDLWHGFMLSQITNTPFLSRKMSSIQEISSILDAPKPGASIDDAYHLCCITMKEQLKYAPVVETMTDVLRLRQHPGITRFREVLGEWTNALTQGEESALKSITKDIGLANKAMAKLERCRKIENWLFWTQIPAGLVPILAPIFSVVSFSTGLLIRHTEKKHSWVTIGR